MKVSDRTIKEYVENCESIGYNALMSIHDFTVEEECPAKDNAARLYADLEKLLKQGESLLGRVGNHPWGKVVRTGYAFVSGAIDVIHRRTAHERERNKVSPQ